MTNIKYMVGNLITITSLIDPTLPEETRKGLTTKGHRLKVYEDGLGNAHGITIERDEAGQIVSFAGGADPRGEGQVGSI